MTSALKSTDVCCVFQSLYEKHLKAFVFNGASRAERLEGTTFYRIRIKDEAQSIS